MVTTGCGSDKQAPSQISSDKTSEKDGEFVLMGFRSSVLEKSMELIKASVDFKSGESDMFDMINVDGEAVRVEIDTENAYPGIYPDSRMLVFYPISDIILPAEKDTSPLGFLHYFDDAALNTIFQVTVTYDPDYVEAAPMPDMPPTSSYQISFQSPNGDAYGLPRSRILEKSEISDEEAFKKFETSSRTVLLGTNSLDQNKFLFIFLKIPGWDDRVFQIFFRWF